MSDTPAHDRELPGCQDVIDRMLAACAKLGVPADAERERAGIAYSADPPALAAASASILARALTQYVRDLIASSGREAFSRTRAAGLITGSQWDIDHTGTDAERAWLASWDLQVAQRTAAYVNATTGGAEAGDVLNPSTRETCPPDLLAVAAYTLASAASGIGTIRLRDVAGPDDPVGAATEQANRRMLEEAIADAEQASKILALYGYPRHDLASGDQQ